MPPGTPSAATWKGLEGDDALPICRACHRHGPDFAQRSIRGDVDFIDDPVPTGLDVQVLSTGGR